MAETLLSKFLRPRLLDVANRKVLQLQASLDRRGINNTEDLSKSISYRVVIRSATDFEIQFFWKAYGDYLNLGADTGFLSRAGNERLTDWVIRKLHKDRKTAKRISKAIQAGWVRGNRFPSVKSKAKGWASQTFVSTQIATDKILIQDALSTAFSKFIKDKIREQNLRAKRR